MPRVSPTALAAIALLAAGCVPSDTDRPAVNGLEAADQPMNELLEVMSHDLGTIAPADRADVRYVTLAHLDNAGASRADLETYRAAMSLALNSLSHGRRVTPPVPVDENATVFRIRLEDYGWDATTWQRLVDDYPYNVRYDRYSEWFEFRDDLADELRAETETSVPYVYGDWLVSTAMRPPLYNDLLELPATLDSLEDRLGIDTVQATHDEQVDRAGFVRSDVSTGNRMIARFALPDLRALWMSCDVAASGDSILDEPVEPICERREVIFTLPNGLPAYYVASASELGERQDVPATSCSTCHSSTGVIPKLDEVRDHVLTNDTAADLDTVLALYPPRGEMSDLVTNDQNIFTGARRTAGVADGLADPLTSVSARHDQPVTVRDAAATLALDEDTFRDILAGSPNVPSEAFPLIRDNGSVPRATWIRIFPDMVCALGLGESCDPHDGGVCTC